MEVQWTIFKHVSVQTSNYNTNESLYRCRVHVLLLIYQTVMKLIL